MELQKATHVIADICAINHTMRQSIGRTIEAVDLTEKTLHVLEELQSVILTAIRDTKPVVGLGAAIPIPPCTELVPAKRGLDALASVLTESHMTTEKIHKPVKWVNTVFTAMTVIDFTSTTTAEMQDKSRAAADATDALVAQYPGKLPKGFKRVATPMIAIAAEIDEKTAPYHDKLAKLQAVFAKLHPVQDVAQALAPLEAQVEPVARAMKNVADQFSGLFAPFKRAVKQIEDATLITIGTAKKRIKKEINALLAKLGIKADVFSAFDKMLSQAEGALRQTVLKPLKTAEKQVVGQITAAEKELESAAREYVEICRTFDAMLARAEKPLGAYLVWVEKHRTGA